MVEVRASVGYMQSDGRMTVDTLVKNTELSSLVIAFDFYSTDVPQRYLTSVSYCIPPFGTSGCVNVRIGNIPFKDPYYVQVRRCISGPNCGANSCGTFSSIADSSLVGEVVRYDGIIPSQATYTIPSDCVPCQTSWSCESPLNGYEYERCTGQRRLNPIACNPFTFNVDKTSVATGDRVTFSGTYKPNTPINIYYQTVVAGIAIPFKNHFASITTQSNGTYMYGATISVTIPGTIRFGACNPGSFGFECGADLSNTVDVQVSYVPPPPPPTPFVLKADKTTVVSGDQVTFSGSYKSNTTINIFIEGAIRTHLAQITTDGSGNYSTTAQVTVEGTLKIGACDYGIGIECGLTGNISNYVTLTVSPIPKVSLTMFVDKTTVVSGDQVTFSGSYKPNTLVNIYWQTVVAGVATPIKNHLDQVTTDSIGKYTDTITITVSIAGTVRFGACSVGGVGFECGDDLSSTVDVQVSYAPPTPFILKVDKTSITSGDQVTFSGSYKPNTTINIFIQNYTRTHIIQLTTDGSGNYSTSVNVIVVGTLKIGACDYGIGIECGLTGNISNIINLVVNPVTFTLSVDKTTVQSGEKITFSGVYRPNRVINIYYQTVVAGVAAPIRNHFTTANTDSAGKYSTIATIDVTIPGTVRFSACVPSIVYGVECEIGGDYSNTADVDVKYYPPTPFILKVDKTSITSGDQVTFSGSYKPNVDINIYYQDTIKHSIVKTTTANNGTFSVTARPASDIKVTLTIGACETGAITECAIGIDTSNTVSLTITPIVPPPPGIRYKCSGAPNYECVETTETGTDTFATKADCIAKCKAGVVCKEGEVSIFGQCVSKTTLGIGAVVAVGAIVLASRKGE